MSGSTWRRVRYRRPAVDLPGESDTSARRSQRRLAASSTTATPFFREREHAEHLADAVRGALSVDGTTDGADGDAGGRRSAEQGECRGWRPRRAIAIIDAVIAPRGAQVLAEQLSGLRR